MSHAWQVQIEPWAQCAVDGVPLWTAHAAEAALEIHPDEARYAALSRSGLLVLAVLRVDGRMVGVHRSVIGPDLHHAGDWYAIADGWYVLPAWRRGRLAVQLLRCAEAELAARGVTALYQASPVRRPLDRLLGRLGYQQTDTLYRRNLLCPLS